MKLKEIPIQPTDWTLDVFICKDIKKIAKVFNKRYGASIEYYEDQMDTDCVLTIGSTDNSILVGETRIIMILAKMDHYVLVHELVHVMWRIQKKIRCEMNYDTQEWQAILFEYLYKECVRIDEYKTIK